MSAEPQHSASLSQAQNTNNNSTREEEEDNHPVEVKEEPMVAEAPEDSNSVSDANVPNALKLEELSRPGNMT